MSTIALAFGVGAAIGFLLGRGGKGAFGVAARGGFQALTHLVMKQVAVSALAPFVVDWFDRGAWRSSGPSVAPSRFG
jgi:hypothetical protein